MEPTNNPTKKTFLTHEDKHMAAVFIRESKQASGRSGAPSTGTPSTGGPSTGALMSGSRIVVPGVVKPPGTPIAPKHMELNSSVTNAFVLSVVGYDPPRAPVQPTTELHVNTRRPSRGSGRDRFHFA